MKNLFLTFRFMKSIIFVIKYLIKHKGNINFVMQEDCFDKDYYVDNDGEDYIIKTTLYDLIGDIYCCNR